MAFVENNLDALDLSGKRLKKLNKPTSTEAHISVLILDDNELQRLDNIDSFTKVQKVLACVCLCYMRLKRKKVVTKFVFLSLVIGSTESTVAYVRGVSASCFAHSQLGSQWYTYH